MLSLFRDLFCVGELAFPSPAFRLEIDEYDYFLNWIEIAAVVLPHLITCCLNWLPLAGNLNLS